MTVETADTEAASVWSRLKKGLGRTRGQLASRIEDALGRGGAATEECLEALEEALLAADLGVETTLELVDRVRAGSGPGLGADVAHLRQRLADEIAISLLDAPVGRVASGGPRVTLIVGVNGVGKTTSIAKLVYRSLERRRTALIAAADTFRAAAIDQLVVWGQRLDVPVIRQNPGADPAAVVYDALQAAHARNIDDVLVDTAGRLHTKKNLMDELAKIGRVVAAEKGQRTLETLLVLDATTGQNALSQAREFVAAVPIDGIFLTKLDGTAKGGIVVSLARELRVPVAFLGVGESERDLVPFNARDFVRALLD